jgi:hypothetical protein
MFAWLISHQPTVLFSQNKSANTNQPAVLFSQNKSASATSHQPNEQTNTCMLGLFAPPPPRKLYMSNFTFGLVLQSLDVMLF